MVHHDKLGCLVKRLDCFVVVMAKVTERFKIPENVHLGDVSSTAEPSVTKLVIVMQHHGSKCYVRRLVCFLQVQGHSEGSYNQILLFLPYFLNF